MFLFLISSIILAGLINNVLYVTAKIDINVELRKILS